MSVRLVAATVLVAMATMWQPAGSVVAQTAVPTDAADLPIAVVDVQGIIRAAKAAKAIHAQIDSRRSAYQEQVSTEEKRLRLAEQDLSQQRAVLAPDAYQQKVREFQSQVAEVQRKVQSRKRELDETFARAMNEVRKSLVSVVAEIAEERGIKVVLFKSQIVIAEKSLDVSDETLQRLDERLPTVKIDLPPIQ